MPSLQIHQPLGRARAQGSIWFTLTLLAHCVFVTLEAVAISPQLATSQIAAIELADVTIESVVHYDGSVPQGPVTVAHHKVDAVIGGSIHIELLLPDDWNGRFVMGGGGGFCGSIQNPHRGAVNSGYATVGTDTGHQAKSIVDGSWALNDLEAVLNFTHLAVHRTCVVSKAIIREAYGKGPKYSYFLGCSNGGRQGMKEAQKYPTDFDGIVAGCPATYDYTSFTAFYLKLAQLVAPKLQGGRALLSDEDMLRLHQEVIKQLDEQDGIKDGIIADPLGVQLDWSSIDWLSESQLAAVKTLYGGIRNMDGVSYPGIPLGAESEPLDSQDYWLCTLNSGFRQNFCKYFVFHDPHWDEANYDLSRWTKDSTPIGSAMNANEADLRPFAEHDGKLIIWHGWSDAAIPATGSVEYYNRVLRNDHNAPNYARLFLIPGCGHCGGGPGISTVDWLKVIVDWVENGKTPERVIAMKAASDDAPEITRPLFPYPHRAQYMGQGDVNKASSFQKLAIPSKLIEATRNADHAGIKALFESNPQLVYARDARGWTPLIYAAFYADADCMQLCIDRGANVNATDIYEATALHYAATNLEKVRLLLQAGVEANVRTHEGTTPFILAANSFDSLAIIDLLLRSGADPNIRNRQGISACTVAARAGNSFTMARLLATCEAPNLDFCLRVACLNGHSEIVKLLLEAGANANSTKYASSTPLLTETIGRDFWDLARILIDGGANIEATSKSMDGVTNDGGSAFAWAASSERGGQSILKLLLTKGADANEEFGASWGPQMNVSYTPLMVARRRGQTDTVQLLLQAGAREVQDPWSQEAKNPPRRKYSEERSFLERRIAAATSAIPSLQETATESMAEFKVHGFNCITCHSQTLPLISVKLAKSKSIPCDQLELEKLNELLRSEANVGSLAEPPIGPPHVEFRGYLSWSLSTPTIEADVALDEFKYQLMTTQYRDGSWPINRRRPPMVGSPFTATALAVRALTGPSRGGQADINDRFRRARKWLMKSTPQTTEDFTFKLLGLHWAGESKENFKPVIDEIIGMQKPGGGWAQLPALKSDAYATGQVLYALQEAAELDPAHPAIAKGLEFLIRDQCADGSWFVRRRAYPLQPTMDPKFPHGRDGWISAAATSWAVMALTVGLDKREVADVLARNKQLASARPYVEPPKELPPATEIKVDYEEHVLPILETSCLGCHASEDPAGKYAMDSREALIKGGFSGPPVVIPGNSADSLLIHHVAGLIEDVEMPPLTHREDYDPLTDEQIGLIRAWIDQGLPGLE